MAKAMNNKDELNKAIYKVLTELKRDCLEEHKMVKKAGYVIEKGRKCFIVSNPETRREIYISERYIVHGWYRPAHRSMFRYGQCKFDFVACLEKPINAEYWRDLHYFQERSKAYEKYDRLQIAKRNVEYEAKRIAECEKQLKELQARLMQATEAKVRDEFKLAEIRKELGLA
jgi:hypothetical protein